MGQLTKKNTRADLDQRQQNLSQYIEKWQELMLIASRASKGSSGPTPKEGAKFLEVKSWLSRHYPLIEPEIRGRIVAQTIPTLGRTLHYEPISQLLGTAQSIAYLLSGAGSRAMDFDMQWHAGLASLNAALGKLEAQIEGRLPKMQDVEPNSLYGLFQLHPLIRQASEALFKDGHHAQAILEAFKAVNNFVKTKSGKDLDGKGLMGAVFSAPDPILKLNPLQSRSDKDEQEGFKFLFMGAMVGIRNPKAHDLIVQTDPVRTLEYLAFASLLMRRAEEASGPTVKQE